MDEKQVLEQAVTDFFPTDGRWYSNCFNKPKELEMDNLPCNLRDDLWMAKMIQKEQKLSNINISQILEFIIKSPMYLEKRHEYEQTIVKWQINYMKNNGENWITDPEYGGDMITLSPECDIGFRKGVVDTLSKIGINSDAIEEGIEANADLWRDGYMNLAFHNRYEPVFFNFGFVFNEKNNDKKIEPVNEEFKENWLKFRKYEYYCDHKKSVDLYGIVEDDMNLSKRELKRIMKNLKIQHEERMRQIGEYKNTKKYIFKIG